ncbi:MAG TPA: helicase-exonuclease AddAB subunit AddB [Lachnospiraceae bacterium]|nr:helicase-exonuclease AddAB subunit AddB [Lachnospiraceae bacterium]
MGLRFYIGGSGSGKSYQVFHDIIDRAMKEPKTTFLVVVPDQFTMQTQKDLVGMHPNRGIMNIDVLSFGRLAHRIFEEVGGNQKPILDDTGKSLVLRLVAEKCKDKLFVVGSNLSKLGYIHEVKSAISEFMQYGIGNVELEELIQYSEKRGALKYKLEDLSILYKEFLEYIKESFITTEETLDVLRDALPKSKILKDAVVVFDGFTGFTPVQNKVIQELMVITKEVIVTSLIDGNEDPYVLDGEQRLFHLSKNTINTLCKLAEEKHIVREKDIVLKATPVYRHKDNMALAHLEKNLFRYNKEVYKGNQDAIALIEVSNPKEEVREVCRMIHNCIREYHYCYRDIAVVTGDLGGYSYHVEEEFDKFSIPYFMDQTNGIILNPFVEFIRSGLQVILKNFTYESMFHYLRSGLTDLKIDQIDELENYILALGIKGKSRWSKLFTRHSKETAGDGEKLEKLNESRTLIMESLEPLLMKQTVTKEWVGQLYTFIINSRIQEKILEYENQFLQIGEIVKAKEYSQIYRLVMELLEQINELLGQDRMKLQEFADILDAGFGEIEVGSIPQNVDRVVIGDMERTRLKEVKVLFFIGINDGIIPKNAGKGGIISDIDREYLSNSNLELAPTPRQQMYIQRLYLYMNMTKPTEKLFLSFSRVNGEGKSIRPAYLIEMIRNMYEEMETINPQQKEPIMELVSIEDSMDLFSDMIRQFAEGLYTNNEKKEHEFYTLYQILQGQKEENKGNKDFLSKFIQSAFYCYESHPLSKAVTEALYGKVLENSISRLEKYAACAYAHFLQYGLSLKEREEYSFEAADMGNLFHGVLEQFSKCLRASEYTWFDFPKEAGEKMLVQALDQYTADYKESILFSSARNQYAITRVKRILIRTLSTLQYQLKKGLFSPEQFEVSFSVLEDLDSVNIALSGDEKMRLKGRIDRVDTYSLEDKIYVKVIDYKSGNKNFDLVALYYGLQLQLVVYLNAAVELEKKRYPDKEVVPAALLYYHVSDPLTERQGKNETPEEINERLQKELRMTGLVNSDSEIVNMLDKDFIGKSDIIPVEEKKDGSYTAASQIMNRNELNAISNYVNHKIESIGKEMLQGNITINPYEMGQNGACTYCNYKSVCGFDVKIRGYEKRQLEVLKKEDIMNKLMEEDSTNKLKEDEGL